MHQENFTVTYSLTPKVETIERVVSFLLAEMTSGIQYISTKGGIKMYRCEDTLSFVDESIKGEIISIEEKEDNEYIVKFSFPAFNINPARGGISVLMAMVAGEVFSFYFIKKARLLDIEFPKAFYDYYRGPQFGIKGIRDLLGVYNRPLLGAIIKPNLGLSPEKTAEVVLILGSAGFDFIKDDEIAVDSKLCPLDKRVQSVAKEVDKVEQKTARKLLYIANVTSDLANLGAGAEIAIKAGADGLLVDPFSMGMSSINYLRTNFSVPVYVHRVGYGLFCSSKDFSISYELFNKLFRMLGADFSHVGGIIGKTEKSKEEVKNYLTILRGYSSIKETFPVVTGIDLNNIRENYEFYGDDTLFMDCVGIYKDISTSTKKVNNLKKNMGLSLGRR